MKLLLIQPSHLDEKGKVYKKALMPTLAMTYIAALNPICSTPFKCLYLLGLINFIIRKGIKKRMRPLLI
ncbi:MAG: hypothetical protein A3C43_12585 [Candidatus Schekmanbacteria bacterium RIFCSPHIGHO2_02_FULL_38_11]|uniref:Uncharacterized protein n=1 Tax=Candidatus Schekmanbacteria bacterium RIFCSPLOWO2_12_FULL_38_15 TaxID=1817883 RepID=A0A1F7SHY5_9BACT|nr:MAG: hypothetical protein A2043_04035 [Candidatus Schekmanbacteria bacterium GWA2_38_9]OGL50819.1 MAG: hypothetical protein A3H37_03135 [Candidatus Schekmanbacteria bacterium RIFCSPLOWO2_02_FULL_38_14]OGL53420.1 MAG: hypothetical protein A3G31_07930 [Candidatus Schekmanbacteria bacterium RIFCSPLOWO2_12_FULL_38_15]OGL55772.1 MAG: hypothetical protein A3C43_12585 [Candidatus Schekmanbacteria bacterium RIFCSPHIGHO2_02_FULL_38_11]